MLQQLRVINVILKYSQKCSYFIEIPMQVFFVQKKINLGSLLFDVNIGIILRRLIETCYFDFIAPENITHVHFSPLMFS